MPLIWITQKGYKDLQEKLDILTNKDLPETKNELQTARELGDLSENAEYKLAREKIAKIQYEVSHITETLQTSKILSKEDINHDIVSFGATVKLINLDNKKVTKYTIVSSLESNVEEGLMSIDAPFAKKVISKKIGDTIEVIQSGNLQEYKILEIEYTNIL